MVVPTATTGGNRAFACLCRWGLAGRWCYWIYRMESFSLLAGDEGVQNMYIMVRKRKACWRKGIRIKSYKMKTDSRLTEWMEWLFPQLCGRCYWLFERDVLRICSHSRCRNTILCWLAFRWLENIFQDSKHKDVSLFPTSLFIFIWFLKLDLPSGAGLFHHSCRNLALPLWLQRVKGTFVEYLKSYWTSVSMSFLIWANLLSDKK